MITENKTCNYELEREISRIKSHLKKQMDEIVKMSSYEFKMICLFSIIDSFAQEISNYEKNSNQKKFSNFVLTYEKSWPFLKKIEPVTLFYDAKNHLIKKDYIDCFMDEAIHNTDDAIKKQIDKLIIADLKSNHLDENEIKKYETKHQFVNLLYQIRNKISHELSDNSHSHLSDNFGHQIPYYRKNSDYKNNNHTLELVIPVNFMFDLVNECCNNYLNSCLKNKKYPFANNTNERKSKLCWYD